MSTPARSGSRLPAAYGGREPAQLADVLERVLDKGIVIAGDIQINLLDIELLTVKIRLLVASADKAREMGIDWWENDPFLGRGSKDSLEGRLKRLEEATGLGDGDGENTERKS
jgi:gas vesicle protein GvpA/GvpJ/GvpM family